ncbi:MAG: PIN domain-containing protein [Candidatus Woesearchaeota archaeon]
MKTVILDTNFLLIPGYFGVDIIDEIDKLLGTYELAVVDKTFRELEHVGQKGKEKKAVQLAYKIIENNKINIVETNDFRHVDAIILDMVTKDHVVATQDRAFRSKLKAKGIPVIILRQKRYLQLVEA